MTRKQVVDRHASPSIWIERSDTRSHPRSTHRAPDYG